MICASSCDDFRLTRFDVSVVVRVSVMTIVSLSWLLLARGRDCFFCRRQAGARARTCSRLCAGEVVPLSKMESKTGSEGSDGDAFADVTFVLLGLENNAFRAMLTSLAEARRSRARSCRACGLGVVKSMTFPEFCRGCRARPDTCACLCVLTLCVFRTFFLGLKLAIRVHASPIKSGPVLVFVAPDVN